MKRKLLAAFLTVFLICTCFCFEVFASGGFVSVRGSGIYHSIYCDAVKGLNCDTFWWFDTAKQAELAGLKACVECSDDADWSFDNDSEYYYWVTENQLLCAAMEMSDADGWQLGYKVGYDTGFSDAECNYEYSCESFYESGYTDGKDHGYDLGYDSGYESGKKEGYRIANKEYEEKHSEEIITSENHISWGWIIFAAIAFFWIGKASEVLKKEQSK